MQYSYKIHIINRDLNLDKTYKNVVQVFNPYTHTKDYTSVFTNAELTFDATDSEIDFDIKDGINASVVLDLQPAETSEEEIANIYKQFGVSSISIKDALSRQYAIVQEQEIDNNGDVQKTNLYFYFITDYNIINSYTIKYILELDCFMTYPLFSDIEVNKTKILRAHVNRFNNDKTFNINNKFLETGEPTDNIFSPIRKENIETPFKNFMNYQYTKLGNITISNETIEKILNNTKWLYVFKRWENVGGSIDANVLLVAPYLEKNPTDYNINFFISQDLNYLQNGHQINANFAYQKLCEDAKVFNAFISPLGIYGSAKANFENYNIAYERISTTQLNIIFYSASGVVVNNQSVNEIKTKSKTAIYDAVNEDVNAIEIIYQDAQALEDFIGYFETNEIELFEANPILYNIPYNDEIIEKAELKTKIRQNYNNYKLKTQMDTSELLIDLSILKTNKVQIKAINNLSGLTNGEIYTTINNENLKDYGIITKSRYTPLMYSDKFNEYKAKNNNYAITGQAIPIASGTLAGAMAGAKIGGVYGAVAGAIIGFGASSAKVAINYDNMQNSPDAIKLKGENITVDNVLKNNFIYLEHNEIRETEKKYINNYFYEYGYTINEIDEISDYFTRSSFNYIQTEDCEKDLHALINKNVLDTIIKALNNGVRFWTPWHYAHSKFAYTTNNLENELNV